MRFFSTLACCAPLCVLSAATVKTENTPLRTGCYEDSQTLASLPKGAFVTVRSARAGETVPCYKVVVESNGKKLEGYLTAAMIEDVESFDNARKSAAWLDLSQIMGSLKNPVQSALIAGIQGHSQPLGHKFEACKNGHAIHHAAQHFAFGH